MYILSCPLRTFVVCLAFPDALRNKDEECEEHLAQHEETIVNQMVVRNNRK
jgi:hypothetical protein